MLPLVVCAGKNPPVAAFQFLELAKLFACGAEPYMNLCNRFFDFLSKFLDPGAHFTGGLQNFDDLLLHKAFGRAWFFWALGSSTAFFDGFCAEDTGCRKDFS